VRIDQYSEYQGIAHFAAGLCIGLTSLPMGLATGVLGDYGVRATAKNPRVFVGMVLMLVFSGAVGLYGMIIALLLSLQK
jgi:V-type H+-transporting ATPase proteolipid subunit